MYAGGHDAGVLGGVDREEVDGGLALYFL